MSRLPVDPWDSTASVRAGLPRERAAWLALVLPAMDASRSHVACAAVLSALCGRKVDRIAVMQWHMKLAAMLAAGTLPERATPLPERRPGWQEGGPTPSPEASRKGAKNRHAGLPSVRHDPTKEERRLARAEERARKLADAVAKAAAQARNEAANLRAAAAAQVRAETSRLRAEAELSSARAEAERVMAEARAAKTAQEEARAAERKAREEARAKATAAKAQAREARDAERKAREAEKAERKAARRARARAKARHEAKRKLRQFARPRPAYIVSPSALAAAAQCSWITSAKALRGERVHPIIRAALEAAATRLGIALPPART